MYAVILTQCPEQMTFIESILSEKQCRNKTVSNASTLERAIRLEFPNFILIDTRCFSHQKKIHSSNAYNLHFIHALIPQHNICIPIFYFDTEALKITACPISEFHKKKCINADEVTALLKHAEDSMQTISKIHHKALRPAEKKLYLLLKNKNYQAVSLDQMEYLLWGSVTGNHDKTLYTYIHRIKHILRDNEDSPELLIKEKKGYYKLTFRKNSAHPNL
ncbi:MAG: helix-turn-helix domain-containing protein [Spirochaetales bacterium]